MEQRGFGDLYAVVMDCVWDCAGPITVGDGFDEISGKRQSYTSVMPTIGHLNRVNKTAHHRTNGMILPICDARLLWIPFAVDPSKVLTHISGSAHIPTA